MFLLILFSALGFLQGFFFKPTVIFSIEQPQRLIKKDSKKTALFWIFYTALFFISIGVGFSSTLATVVIPIFFGWILPTNQGGNEAALWVIFWIMGIGTGRFVFPPSRSR